MWLTELESLETVRSPKGEMFVEGGGEVGVSKYGVVVVVVVACSTRIELTLTAADVCTHSLTR